MDLFSFISDIMVIVFLIFLIFPLKEIKKIKNILLNNDSKSCNKKINELEERVSKLEDKI